MIPVKESVLLYRYLGLFIDYDSPFYIDQPDSFNQAVVGTDILKMPDHFKHHGRLFVIRFIRHQKFEYVLFSNNYIYRFLQLVDALVQSRTLFSNHFLIKRCHILQDHSGTVRTADK